MSPDSAVFVDQTPVQPDRDLINLAYLIYGLHFISAVNGVLSTAFIITAFLTGWPSILAVVLNYVKREDTRGTWLYSHFMWQIRTFWYALLWLVVAAFMLITIVLAPLAYLVVVFTGIWVLYRIVRGFLRLSDRKPMVTANDAGCCR